MTKRLSRSGLSGGLEDPFLPPRRPLWHPNQFQNPPSLPDAVPGEIERNFVLLINPFYRKDPHASFGKHVLTPSLALLSVAGATPAHWKVKYWDENLLMGPPPNQPIPRVVGITVHLTFAARAYELARWYRRKGSIVVMGGLHMEACADEASVHADIIVSGNGVSVWPQVLHDIEQGCPQSRYRGSYSDCYDAEPKPRRDLLPKGSFLTTTSLVATRGCHNRCGFCYLSTADLRVPYQKLTPENVVRQIIDDGQPYVVFTDNNLGSDAKYLKELCLALEPLKIIWSAAISLDVSDDPHLIRAMALAGCTGVFIGFESLNDENLVAARKRTPRALDYGRRVQLFHDNGIQVNGSFVLGFDGDGPDVFERTAQWIEEHRLECATFHILTPYPGTPLFHQLEEQGRILHRDWTLYDTGHVVFEPRRLTAEELLMGYDWLYRRLFSIQSIWRRRPRGSAEMLSYLAMSLLYKKCNMLWRLLIKARLVHSVWRPLICWTQWRHLAYRKRLSLNPVKEPCCSLPDHEALESMSPNRGTYRGVS